MFFRKLEHENAVLGEAIKQNDVLSILVRDCPDSFQDKIISDDNWMSAITGWLLNKLLQFSSVFIRKIS